MDGDVDEVLRRVGSSSTEELLWSGGDSRHAPTDVSGRNRYGNRYRPVDGLLSLGSCTSSTVSPEAFDVAVRIHQRLRTLDPEPLGVAVETLADGIRSEILDLFAGPRRRGVDVVLTPSGTDAELVALLAASGPERPLTTVLVGAAEAGSGTALAAAGRHFDAVTPSGSSVTVGDPVDEALVSRVRAEHVDVRDGTGRLRLVTDVDREVRDRTLAALGAGRDVLVHVMAHSKTGVHAPSLASVDALVAGAPARVRVVVDAAQARSGRRSAARWLDRGFAVIVTGSKFYGGPPFAGALLLPRPGGHGPDPALTVPAGFGNYLAASMLPASWGRARHRLGSATNLGLLVRWCAALEEVRRYDRVPAEVRRAVRDHFDTVAPRVLAATAGVDVEPAPPAPDEDSDDGSSFEALRTVVSFGCRTADGRLLGADELRDLHRRMLDAAPSPEAGPAEPEAVEGVRVELGQPVVLGSGASARAVLRVALGARQVLDVARYAASGSGLAAGLDALGDDLRRTAGRIETLLAAGVVSG